MAKAMTDRRLAEIAAMNRSGYSVGTYELSELIAAFKRTRREHKAMLECLLETEDVGVREDGTIYWRGSGDQVGKR